MNGNKNGQDGQNIAKQGTEQKISRRFIWGALSRTFITEIIDEPIFLKDNKEISVNVYNIIKASIVGRDIYVYVQYEDGSQEEVTPISIKESYRIKGTDTPDLEKIDATLMTIRDQKTNLYDYVTDQIQANEREFFEAKDIIRKCFIDNIKFYRRREFYECIYNQCLIGFWEDKAYANDFRENGDYKGPDEKAYKADRFDEIWANINRERIFELLRLTYLDIAFDWGQEEIAKKQEEIVEIKSNMKDKENEIYELEDEILDIEFGDEEEIVEKQDEIDEIKSNMKDKEYEMHELEEEIWNIEFGDALEL